MQLILRFCLLIISITGYLVFFIQKYQIRIEFAPALFCAWTSNLLFVAGLLNILPHMVWLLWGGGFFLFVWSVKNKYRLDRRSTLLYGIFLCAAVYFFYLMQGTHITSYDNFSHWATVVKDMLRENRMPNFEDKIIRFQSYPLGSSLFIYGVCLLVGEADSCMLWAQLFMQVSFLFCLAVFVQKNNRYAAFIPAVYSIWALSANNSIYELRVDTLLPLTGTASFIMLYNYRKKPKQALCSASGIWMLLINTKNSGIFFYFVSILFFVLYEKKELKQHKRCFLCFGLFAPLFTMFLWKRHVAFAFADGMSAKHSMNLSHFSEMAAKKTSEDVAGIGIHILKRFADPDNIELKMMFLLTAFLFAAAIGLRRYGLMKKMIVLCVAAWGCLAVYTASLYAMYVFSMPMGESARLASYDRYILSVLIFIYGIAVTVFISEIPKIQYFSSENQMHRPSVYIITITVLLSAALIWQVQPRLSGFYEKPDFDGTKRSDLQKLIRKYGIQEGDSCFIYCNGSDDDVRYLFYLSRYELWSNEIFVSSAEAFTEQKERIPSYDYLIIWEPDACSDSYLKQTAYSRYQGMEKIAIVTGIY